MQNVNHIQILLLLLAKLKDYNHFWQSDDRKTCTTINIFFMKLIETIRNLKSRINNRLENDLEKNYLCIFVKISHPLNRE